MFIRGLRVAASNFSLTQRVGEVFGGLCFVWGSTPQMQRQIRLNEDCEKSVGRCPPKSMVRVRTEFECDQIFDP